MISVFVYKQANYPVPSKKIKQAVIQTLEDNGIVSNYEVSVGLVGDSKMDELVETYMQEKNEPKHPVLSFPVAETQKPFVFPEGETPQLGDIIISYPQALEAANKENKLIEDVICDLARHATLHLIGIHHD